MILTASIMWDATEGAVRSDPMLMLGTAPVAEDGISTAERIRAVFVGTVQTGGFYLVASILAYSASALLARTPLRDQVLGEEI